MEVEICDSPVFVLGPPRSGTSMMQWALRSHPHMWGGQESDFMIPLVTKLREVWEFGGKRGDLHWISGQDVTWEEFLRYFGIGVNALYTNRSKGLRWVEQTPQYTLHLESMKLLLPGSRFLFMVRDGREVVHSLRNFVNPVEHRQACETWRNFIQAGLDFSNGGTEDSLLFVSYAETVTNTESELQKVFDFLDEPFAPESVEFIRSKDPINSSFPGQDSSSRRWLEWTREERAEFDRVAGSLLLRLGFEEDSSWVDHAVDV